MPAQKRPLLPASPAAGAAEPSPPSPSTAEKRQAEDPAPPPPPPQQEVKDEAADADADAVEEGDEPQKQQQQQQDVVKDEEEREEEAEAEEEEEEEEGQENQQPELPQERQDDSEGEGGGGGSDLHLDDGEEDEVTADDEQLIPVRLADIRKEVQCPICLGIIRKTRTVMECLHRFCRECIDKSMRLGNNECPACRTHCASRRSLRDDSNYDFLISAIYADIDKYEEEELAFREEEKSRNKKIQAAIAETFRRQAEALGKKRYTAKTTAAAFVRRSQGNYRNHGQNSYFRGRGRSYCREAAVAASDDDDELEANNNDDGKESSADEPSPERRQKRCKRWGVPRSSPARVVGSADAGSAENDDIEVNKETIRTSPLRAGEILAWGKNGTRSQTRHGSSIGGSAGRMVKGRMTRLVDHLRNLDQTDQFDVHLALFPLDEKSNLQQPYVCCRPTMSIKHICEFIALQASVQAEEVQLYANKIQGGTSRDVTRSDPLEGQVLEEQETLGSLANSYTTSQGELVLFYNLKMQS